MNPPLVPVCPVCEHPITDHVEPFLHEKYGYIQGGCIHENEAHKFTCFYCHETPSSIQATIALGEIGEHHDRRTGQ